MTSITNGLASAALCAVVTLLALLGLLGHSVWGSMTGVAWVTAIGFLVAWALAIFVGFPFHLLFRRLQIDGVVPYLLVGLAAGLLPPLLEEGSRIWEGRTARSTLDWWASAGLLCIPCGLVGSAVFWTLCVRHRRR
jgi:hypothetical protein